MMVLADGLATDDLQLQRRLLSERLRDAARERLAFLQLLQQGRDNHGPNGSSAQMTHSSDHLHLPILGVRKAATLAERLQNGARVLRPGRTTLDSLCRTVWTYGYHLLPLFGEHRIRLEQTNFVLRQESEILFTVIMHLLLDAREFVSSGGDVHMTCGTTLRGVAVAVTAITPDPPDEEDLLRRKRLLENGCRGTCSEPSGHLLQALPLTRARLQLAYSLPDAGADDVEQDGPYRPAEITQLLSLERPRHASAMDN